MIAHAHDAGMERDRSRTGVEPGQELDGLTCCLNHPYAISVFRHKSFIHRSMDSYDLGESAITLRMRSWKPDLSQPRSLARIGNLRG